MEWVDKKSGESQIIKGMHTYHFHTEIRDGFAQWKKGLYNPIYHVHEISAWDTLIQWQTTWEAT